MKKRNIKAMVTGLVLAAAMAVTPIMAMAAPEAGETPAAGTEDTVQEKPSGIPIKKTVHIADHTTITNAEDTYTFKFTQVDPNADGITSPTNIQPFIKTIDSLVLDHEGYKTDNEIAYDKQETFDLKDVLANAPAGEYTFKIKEEPPTSTSSTGDFGWTSVDSKEVYAHVVKSVIDNVATYHYYLTETNVAGGSETEKLKSAAFDNTYTGKGNKSGDSSLTIGKDVIDDSGITDPNDTFTLQISFTFPTTATEAQKSFTGTVSEGGPKQAATVTVDAKDAKDANTASVEVVLKRDGRVTFTNVPSGTTYKVSEKNMSRESNYDYTNTAVKVGGTDGTTTFEDKNGSQPHAVDTDGVNEAIVNNTAKSVSQTGVFLSNMPFIVMMAAAAAAIFGYVALKRKISK